MEKTVLDSGFLLIDVFFREKKHIKVRELGYQDVKRAARLLDNLLNLYLDKGPEGEDVNKESIIGFVMEYFESMSDWIFQIISIVTDEPYAEVCTWPPALTFQVSEAIVEVNYEAYMQFQQMTGTIKKKIRTKAGIPKKEALTPTSSSELSSSTPMTKLDE